MSEWAERAAEAIAGLDDPTPSEVARVTREFDARDVAAAAGSLASGAVPGGSQPGAVCYAEMVFDEPAAPHADMTATLDIPAGGSVVDMVFIPLVNTFADTVTLDVVDDDGKTYFDAFQVGPSGYWTAYVADGRGKTGAGNDFDVPGNQSTDYAGAVEWPDPTTTSRIPGVPYPAGTTITATVAGIATGGGGGKFILRVIYSTAPATNDFA